MITYRTGIVLRLEKSCKYAPDADSVEIHLILPNVSNYLLHIHAAFVESKSLPLNMFFR